MQVGAKDGDARWAEAGQGRCHAGMRGGRGGCGRRWPGYGATEVGFVPDGTLRGWVHGMRVSLQVERGCRPGCWGVGVKSSRGATKVDRVCIHRQNQKL